MRNKKQMLKEDITITAATQFKYLVFIDASSYIQRGNGLMTNIFRDMGAPKIAKWFRSLAASSEFKEHANDFKSITTRFAGNSSLRVLLVALMKIKSKEITQDNSASIEKDITIILGKISKHISSKLSDQDQELFDSVSKYINVIAATAAKTLSAAIQPSEPEPAEEPTDDKGDDKEASKDDAKVDTDKDDDSSDSEKSDDDSGEEAPDDGSKDDAPDEESKDDDSAKSDDDTKKESIQRRVTTLVREILEGKR